MDSYDKLMEKLGKLGSRRTFPFLPFQLFFCLNSRFDQGPWSEFPKAVPDNFESGISALDP